MFSSKTVHIEMQGLHKEPCWTLQFEEFKINHLDQQDHLFHAI